MWLPKATWTSWYPTSKQRAGWAPYAHSPKSEGLPPKLHSIVLGAAPPCSEPHRPASFVRSAKRYSSWPFPRATACSPFFPGQGPAGKELGKQESQPCSDPYSCGSSQWGSNTAASFCHTAAWPAPAAFSWEAKYLLGKSKMGRGAGKEGAREGEDKEWV